MSFTVKDIGSAVSAWLFLCNSQNNHFAAQRGYSVNRLAVRSGPCVRGNQAAIVVSPDAVVVRVRFAVRGGEDFVVGVVAVLRKQKLPSARNSRAIQGLRSVPNPLKLMEATVGV